MNIDFDNPKWTAYVLGELSPEERAAVELELAASVDGQAFVRELELAASTMKDELGRQPLPGLSFEQRKAVREAAGAASSRQVALVPLATWSGWLTRFPWWAAAGVAVASLVVAVAVWRSGTTEPVRIAKVDEQQKSAPPSAGPIPPEDSGAKTGVTPGNTTKTLDGAGPVNSTVPTNVQANTQSDGLSVTAPRPAVADTVIEDRSGRKDNGAVDRAALERLRAKEGTVPRSNPPAPPAPSVLPSRGAVVPVQPSAPVPSALPVFSAQNVVPPFPPALNDGANPFGNNRDSFGAGAPPSGPAPSAPMVPPVADRLRQAQSANLGNANNLGGAARGGGGGGGRGGAPAAGGRGGAGAGLGPGAGQAGGQGQGQGQGGGIGQGQGRGAAAGGGAGGGREGFLGGVGTAGANPFSLAELPAASFSPMPLAPEPQPPLAPAPVLLSRAIPVDIYGLRVDNRSNADTYTDVTDNPFMTVPTEERDLPTFAIDVDPAGYANVRRFLNANQLPPHAAVRIEELINYFNYDYPRGATDHPITANIEAAAAPWNPQHRLVRIGLKAKDVQVGEKPSNLVFLIDVSGSMEPADRLPLLKSGLRLLVQRLTENDRITIVTYSGESGIALPPTNGSRKDVILAAIDKLRAEGSTNGGAGIQTAYDMAAANFIRGGVNRVVLMTDGDFNVGITNQNDLVRMIEEKAKTGVFLSVLGVGSGNLKDSTMERLADRGNGLYAYIDSMNEARRVLVDQMAGTLIAVAKDVKVQVEFNPTMVAAYRLIGYENRALTAADFNNDNKDAGDMGAGHTVTALFEVVPVSAARSVATATGSLRYQQPAQPAPAPAPTANIPAALAREMLELKIKYKDPEGTESKQIRFQLVDRNQTFESASVDFRFAAAVAEFGMLLRSSPYRGASAWESVISIANGSRGADREGYREEFVRLAQRAQQLGGGVLRPFPQ